MENIRTIPEDYHFGEPKRRHIEDVLPPYVATDPLVGDPKQRKLDEDRKGKELVFEIHQEECRSLFGPDPRSYDAYFINCAMFHEAAVFVPGASADENDSLFVTSNRLPEGCIKGHPDGIVLIKLERDKGKWGIVTWLPDTLPMPNGAVNYPSKDSVLFCAQGTATHPGGLHLMLAKPPHTTTPLLTSYHGRWFNSTNDVIVAQDGAVWFTDPIYGFEQGFRPKPQLPGQVYRFDPARGDLRPVVDGLGRPNGLCFSPDEKTLYVTDTDYIHGDGTMVDARVSHIYAFTIEYFSGGPFAINRRVFAMADVGAPDGIKCDLQGNVYSGCGDGINIWAPSGMLLGKILVPGGVANFCFGRPGELLLLNENRFWPITVAKDVQGALLKGMGIEV